MQSPSFQRQNPRRKPKINTRNMTEDEKLAWDLQREEHNRYRRLHAQYDSEMKALSHGMLATKQRVSYHHRGSDEHYDAVIMGVHLDDGPDKPYYTIKYQRRDKVIDEDGVEQDVLLDIEKQTDPDRLTRVSWDEDKAFKELEGTKVSNR
eukprot:CAMPEP_0195520900 /NCGR_PEP_ID=MMETSP0794_2-20130614/17609_1 /TAXON_ID=515487 /ORGANISM="Stephanopyxis turris, Strain CCMP 815" /LENGTH=149 /DNA_ID=CAMNT_0040650339 /DNA_START=245 /DNA_END=694 /DNA_ORIENTATION=-